MVLGGKLQAALRKGGCTQVMRASYLSAGQQIMATIGVLNLANVTAAEQAGKATGATAFIKQLPGAKGPTRNLMKGTGLEEAEIKGHYLILTWAEFTDLQGAEEARSSGPAGRVLPGPGRQHREHQPDQPDAARQARDHALSPAHRPTPACPPAPKLTVGTRPYRAQHGYRTLPEHRHRPSRSGRARDVLRRAAGLEGRNLRRARLRSARTTGSASRSSRWRATTRLTRRLRYVPQQMHLDASSTTSSAAEAALLELGATKHEHQPGTTFRVFLDPAGHPFCLCLDFTR